MTLNLGHGRRHLRHQALGRPETLERNVAAIGAAVSRLGPDVVALQEADGPSSWSGNFDHVAALGEHSGLPELYRGDHMKVAAGNLKLRYGTALLARHQLSGTQSQRFGANWRDTKGFVVATVAVPAWGGEELDLASVHLDFLRPTVRRRQIRCLVEALSGRGRPLVVMGDLNCCWHWEPRTMELLTRHLRLQAYAPQAHAPTYPAKRPLRRLDWVLISERLEFARHLTLPAALSDHLGVVADIRLTAG